MIRLTYFFCFLSCFLFLNVANAQKSSFEQKTFETENYMLIYPKLQGFTKNQPTDWVNAEILKKVKALAGNNIFERKTGKFKEEIGSTALMYEITENNQDTLSIVFALQYMGASLNFSMYGLNLDLKNKQVILLDSLIKDKKQEFNTFAKKYIKTSEDCQLEEEFSVYDFSINSRYYTFYLPETNFSGGKTCLNLTSFIIPKDEFFIFLKPKNNTDE